MKGLYKLAVAFEKASQVPAGGYYNPNKPSDPKIMSMQTSLINLGFPLPGHGADGIMGNETQQALNAFKAQHGLRNASPDVVQTRLHAEADKLLGGRSDEPTNQLAFKVNQPAPAPAKSKGLQDMDSLNPKDPSGFVGPNHFVNTPR